MDVTVLSSQKFIDIYMTELLQICCLIHSLIHCFTAALALKCAASGWHSDSVLTFWDQVRGGSEVLWPIPQCFKNMQEIYRQTLSLFPHFHLQHRKRGTENHVHTLSFSIFDFYFLSHMQKNKSSHSHSFEQPSQIIIFCCWKYTINCTDTERDPEVRADRKRLFYSIPLDTALKMGYFFLLIQKHQNYKIYRVHCKRVHRVHCKTFLFCHAFLIFLKFVVFLPM